MSSQANDLTRGAAETAQARIMRAQRLLAAGGLLGALAASSCCVVPLALFMLGISGAWIGNLTRLAPYQPYFIAATAACLGGGYWLLHRSRRVGCAEGEVCGRPLPRREYRSDRRHRSCCRRACRRFPRPALSLIGTGGPACSNHWLSRCSVSVCWPRQPPLARKKRSPAIRLRPKADRAFASRCVNHPQIHDHLPGLRDSQNRDDADRCLLVFLRMCRLRRGAAAKAGRLLRILLLRLRPVPAAAREAALITIGHGLSAEGRSVHCCHFVH